MTGLVLYGIVGFLYALLEHRTFDFDFTGLATSEAIIAVLQQVVHYIRIIAVFPLYMLEDLLIYIDNSMSHGGVDE